MGDTESENKNSHLEAAREYAWNWFELHAKQRQQSFHFYLILVGSILGAYFFSTRLVPQGPASQAPQYSAWPLLISILAVAISLLFYRLERRNRALVRYAEAALRRFEKDFHEKLGENLAPAFIDAAANPRCNQDDYLPGLTTYGNIYKVIFWVGIVAGAIGIRASWPPQGIGRLLNSLFL